MFRNKNFNCKEMPCFDKETLSADLELESILSTMAQKDEIINDSCSSALFCPLQSIEEIHYRQENLRDAIRNADAVRRLYEITIETEKMKEKSWCWLSYDYLSGTFSVSVELLTIYTQMLMKLRLVADNHLDNFQSEGFRALLTMFQRELDDDYFAAVQSLLDDMNESDGMEISAKFGSYMQGVDYVLRRKTRDKFRRRWRFAPSYTVEPQDNVGIKDIELRRDRAINEATNALAQAAEHLDEFFSMLRGELAFYVGCLNLADRLKSLNMPISIPNLLPSDREDRSWEGLYDVSLTLKKNSAVVTNDLSAENKRLYVITGANQGGKSTFLRSLGQAQLMAQSGMFVGADSFTAPIRRGVFSHFKKEEDNTMNSGKLDEELTRMSELADHLEDGTLMLFNESFAATNEREGSEICRQITRALIENGMEVFSVTHLYTYALSFLKEKKVQYLRAQRLENGERNFKMIPGDPLQTAFGEDIYQKIFAEAE